ncbi:MAG TPA: RNA polymerase sigma factor [Thermoanaerobaculia bacterium]|nr:RNA polymerase sigma factor [Thermoanaerobaculia bacterium]
MTSTSAPTDRVVALVERIQAGIDYENSCREIYHLFRRRIFGFFAAHAFSADECAELTQETFIRVFLGIGRLHFADRFSTWLFEIAANVYRNELRRRGAGKRDAYEESIEDLVQTEAAGRPDAVPALSSQAPDPLAETLRRERLECLRGELDQLPPQMRRCMYLRLYQDLKYREIAFLMDISIETVKAHLHQAQKRLKVVFSDRQGDEESQGAL